MPLYHLKPFSSPNIWKKIQTLLHMVCKAPKVQALVSCQLCLMSASPCTDHDTPSRLLSLVQFSCSVVSDSPRPHESQHARPPVHRSVMPDSLRLHESHHARPPCPSPTPGVHSNSCPSSQWCHPAISSSVIPFSSCPQTLPASESFPMSQLYSAIKKNTFESVLMRWMKLEPIIQSEVSQKEKHQYSILTHIYGI